MKKPITKKKNYNIYNNIQYVSVFLHGIKSVKEYCLLYIR